MLRGSAAASRPLRTQSEVAAPLDHARSLSAILQVRQAAIGDGDNQLDDGFLVGEHPVAVDIEKHEGRQPRQALIAVDQGVVRGQRVQQGCCFDATGGR